jgi:alpha-pyrone synthase
MSRCERQARTTMAAPRGMAPRARTPSGTHPHRATPAHSRGPPACTTPGPMAFSDPATAHLNRVAAVVPPHDIHPVFTRFAESSLTDPRARAMFGRMADRAEIAHRYSVLPPAPDPEGPAIDTLGLYARGQFPTTRARMEVFEERAPLLAARAVEALDLGEEARKITHLIVTTCTGFVAPGVDLDLIDRFGLDPSIERTVVGFMGCHAALNALKLARHIVRSRPTARVLVVNLELCTLHLQETSAIEELLCFLLFGDGCAASVVSAEPVGLALDAFHTVLVPDTRRLITWTIGDLGFEMVLSGRVPSVIARALEAVSRKVLGGASPREIDRWAVHPGGRTVLDAVEQGLSLGPDALAISRGVLRAHGNMSSATVMFVLRDVLAASSPGERGVAMSFGPGLTAESMLFRRV